MTDKAETLDRAELQGVALAAYSLSASTLRLLKKHGALGQDDINAILTGVLLTLESSDLVSEPAAHAARVLLSGLATELDVPMKPTN